MSDFEIFGQRMKEWKHEIERSEMRFDLAISCILGMFGFCGILFVFGAFAICLCTL